MGMTIYVQKLSNPAEEWDVDVEPSDTIEAVKQKIQDKESPAVYGYLKIALFYNATELLNESTLSDYNIQKFSQLTSSYESSTCDPIYDMFDTPTEDGCIRAKRLWLLGYI
jgi:hypothetical protein